MRRLLKRQLRLVVTSLVAALACVIGLSYATLPAGLDSRSPFPAYLNGAGSVPLPTTTAGSMPALLSQTGAFTDTAARIPHPGLIPYNVNSALWTDGSLKSRFVGVPYDGTANSPKVGFTTTGAWLFPIGTVFVKNFDLLVDERAGALNPIRRVETRILVRLSDGGIRGATYKWRPDNSDADLIAGPTPYPDEPITITQPDNSTRAQAWTYPVPSQCLICHNTKSGMVLGPKTAQLNGDITYPATGRTDNQLHTWNHLGMFDQTIADPPTQYARMVEVNDTSATMEDRVKSYQDSNCSHCHRPGASSPGNNGPLFDMRYETPILASGGGRIPIVANAGIDGLVRRDIGNSSIHQRDGSTVDPMPPLARNVPDQRILSLYSQWVNYAFDVTTATATSLTQVKLQFDRALEPVSAAVTANYAINGVTVLQATVGADPSVVTLSTSQMTPNVSYQVTINRVKEAVAPQNPIWPNTVKSFTVPVPTSPGAPSITGFQIGNGQATFSLAPPASDGGSAVLAYTVTCMPGAFSATGASGPLTVTGLSNGVTYSCTARATNSIGTGPASPAENVMPVAVPDAPTALTAAAGNGSATLSFAAPNDNGAPITSYVAQCGAVTGGGTGSPITISGLANGTSYSCSVAAVNSVGTGAYSLPVDVTPNVPKLQAVVSRKSHAAAGIFDLPIDHLMSIGGPVTVEPRVIGSGHLIVFQFDMAVSAAGVAASTGSVTVQFTGNEVIATLTDVNDGDRVQISLTNVNGAGVDVSAAAGFLVGDVNDSGTIDAVDARAVKARAGQEAGSGNFFYDLNASGQITASEVSAAKARIGRALQP